MGTKPFIGLNLYLDADSGGTQNLARKSLNIHNVQFSRRVESFGYVDRNIPFPPGLLQIDDAEVVINDDDGQIREWFAAVTPFRRIAEIVVLDESDVNAFTDRTLPVSGWTENFTTQQPLPDQYWEPLFTGEIVPNGVKFETAKCTLRLREVTNLWLEREIPKLIIRDNFPNLPDDANEGATDYTAPIIFGIVQCYSALHVEPQGAIKCHYIDTVNHYYCVARHQCNEVYAVYRRKKNDARFKQVNSLEYEILTVNYTINGVVYPFTVVHFFVQQEDGTHIQAEVNGINYYYDFDSGAQITGVTQRNPVRSLQNLVYALLQTEVNLERFDPVSWKAAIADADDLGYVMDGAITDTMSVGNAIAQMCGDFDIDFYQNNQDKIAVGIYNPASDATIPIDADIVLKNTFKPDLPEKVYTTIRYRYARDNAGLIEFVKSSHTGHYGFEELVTNLDTKAELESTTKNASQLELVVELNFVRDDDVALALQKRRLGYFDLRSYVCTFEVPMPEVISYLRLASPLSVTHRQGIGAMGTGWDQLHMKVTSILFDLSTYHATVKAVRRLDLDDSQLEWSYTGSHPAHSAQTRIPPLSTLINGTEESAGVIRQTAEPQININDSDPPIPSVSADLPSSFDVSYFAGGSVDTTSEPTSDAAIVQVKWLEDQTSVPRKASAYALVPGGRFSTKWYVGTLSPDTRPTLSDSDINKAIFYSTDFDHEYLYVGTGEGGTPSGWRAIEQSAGNIVMRTFAPTGPGYHLCNGSTVSISDYEGNVGSINLPDLTGGVYPKLDSSYDGPTSTVAHAPGASSGSAGAHAHDYSGTTSEDGGHTPIVDPASTIIDLGHHHTVALPDLAFDLDVSISAAGSHAHTGSTDGGSDDGAHSHTGATGPHGDTGFEDDHVHHIPAEVTASAGDHGHSISHTDVVATITSASQDAAPSEGEGLAVSGIGDTVEVDGTTENAGAHTHGYGDVDTGAASGDITIPAGVLDIDIPSGGDHHHAISSDGSHSHVATLTATGGSGATIDTSAKIADADPEFDLSITIEAVADHDHSYSGTTSSNGAHSHTVTVDATAEPKRMKLLPYMRL